MVGNGGTGDGTFWEISPHGETCCGIGHCCYVLAQRKTCHASGKEAAVKPAPSSVPEPVAKAVLEKEPSGAPKVTEKSPSPSAEANGLMEQAVGLKEKNLEEAKSLLLKAVRIDPSNIQGQFQLGTI